MILIPEQVRNIRKEIKARSNEEDYYDTSYQLGSSSFLNEINLLDTCEYLNERVVDHIDIGTRFTVMFDDDREDTEELTLVEILDGVNARDGFISLSSPLGQAVHGLHEGEETYYNIPRGKMKIKILSIDKNKDNYLSMIRSIASSYRVCRTEKATLNMLHNTDIEAYKERFQITNSQRQLLIQELKKIERNLNLSNKDASTARIGAIRKCLKENKVAEMSDDGTIGIGSIFTVKILLDDKEEEMNVELINRAVSTEYPGEYLERVSSLGSKVYGLHEGEEFVFNGPNGKNISGVVYNIKNNKNTNNLSNLTYTK